MPDNDTNIRVSHTARGVATTNHGSIILDNECIPINEDQYYSLCQFQADGGVTGVRFHFPDGIRTKYYSGRCTVFNGQNQYTELAPNVVYRFRGGDLASCMSPSAPHADWWGSRWVATPHNQFHQSSRVNPAPQEHSPSRSHAVAGTPSIGLSHLGIRTQHLSPLPTAPKSGITSSVPSDTISRPVAAPNAQTIANITTDDTLQDTANVFIQAGGETVPISPGTAYSVRHAAEGHGTEVTAWKRSHLPWHQTQGEVSILSGACVFGNGHGEHVKLGKEDRITFNSKGETFRTLPFSNVARPCDLWKDLKPCTKEGVPLPGHRPERGRWSQAPPFDPRDPDGQSRPRR